MNQYITGQEFSERILCLSKLFSEYELHFPCTYLMGSITEKQLIEELEKLNLSCMIIDNRSIISYRWTNDDYKVVTNLNKDKKLYFNADITYKYPLISDLEKQPFIKNISDHTELHSKSVYMNICHNLFPNTYDEVIKHKLEKVSEDIMLSNEFFDIGDSKFTICDTNEMIRRLKLLYTAFREENMDIDLTLFLNNQIIKEGKSMSEIENELNEGFSEIEFNIKWTSTKNTICISYTGNFGSEYIGISNHISLIFEKEPEIKYLSEVSNLVFPMYLSNFSYFIQKYPEELLTLSLNLYGHSYCLIIKDNKRKGDELENEIDKKRKID